MNEWFFFAQTKNQKDDYRWWLSMMMKMKKNLEEICFVSILNKKKIGTRKRFFSLSLSNDHILWIWQKIFFPWLLQMMMMMMSLRLVFKDFDSIRAYTAYSHVLYAIDVIIIIIIIISDNNRPWFSNSFFSLGSTTTTTTTTTMMINPESFMNSWDLGVLLGLLDNVTSYKIDEYFFIIITIKSIYRIHSCSFYIRHFYSFILIHSQNKIKITNEIRIRWWWWLVSTFYFWNIKKFHRSIKRSINQSIDNFGCLFKRIFFFFENQLLMMTMMMKNSFRCCCCLDKFCQDQEKKLVFFHPFGSRINYLLERNYLINTRTKKKYFHTLELEKNNYNMDKPYPWCQAKKKKKKLKGSSINSWYFSCFWYTNQFYNNPSVKIVNHHL